MIKLELIDKIKTMAKNCLDVHGLEFVDITYFYQANRLNLRLFIDRPSGGVTIDECAVINEELGDMLDSSGILEQSYVLEVSSPGIGRELRAEEDFRRVLKRRLRVLLKEAVKGRTEIVGIATKINGFALCVDAGREEFIIPFDKIIKAKQVIE